jgi:hypothetical protein
MIESPLIGQLAVEWQQRATHSAMQRDIVRFLGARFGPVPPELVARVQAIRDDARRSPSA